MTKLIIVLLALSFSACSSAPRKILMKNCEEAGSGSGLYYCEEMPEKIVRDKR